MIRFFPNTFPEEILYSIISRFGKVLFPNNPTGLARCLFGNPRLRASIDLNSHLKVFLERTGTLLRLTESQLIHNHTLYPFYSCFLNEIEKSKIFHSMLSNSGINIHTRVGINSSRLKRIRNPKYCPLCIAEDIQRFGELFWHRAHQIPGIDVCHIHNVLLETHQPDLNQIGHGYYLYPPDELIKEKVRMNTVDILFYLSRRSHDILVNNSFGINNVNYYTQLTSLGYCKNKRINYVEIHEKFQTFYGKQLTNNLSRHIGRELGWINEIIRRPTHIFNPVRHILFSKFCDELPSKLHTIYNPFQQGPWICYNKASDHYLKYVVNDLQIHTDRKSKRQIGVLTCNCGMVYTMSLIKNNENRSVKKHVRIKNFGEKWNLKLKVEISSGKSLRQIAKILGTDAKTIALKAKSLTSTHTKRASPNKNLNQQKREWTDFFKKNTTKTVKEARQEMSAIYASLYRHANKWLLAFNASKRKVPGNQIKLRIDWGSCDQIILAKLQDAISYLNQSGFKGRITKTLLAKIIGHEGQLLNSNINKLPKSYSLLNQKIESKDEFQKRRIRIAIDELKQDHKLLKRWKVIKQSRLRSSLRSNLIQYTEKLLKRYG